MNLLDGLALAALVVSAGVGVVRGAAYELISLGGWVAAFFVAHLAAPWAANHLPAVVAEPTLRAGVAWGGCFVATLLAAGLLATLVRLLLRSTGLGLLDRSMGALFGLARGALLVLVALFAASYTALPHSALWQASILVPPATAALDALLPALPLAVAHALPAH